MSKPEEKIEPTAGNKTEAQSLAAHPEEEHEHTPVSIEEYENLRQENIKLKKEVQLAKMREKKVSLKGGKQLAEQFEKKEEPPKPEEHTLDEKKPHYVGPWQRFCPTCGEQNPDFKDETECKDCHMHLGPVAYVEKLKACPNCGGHNAKKLGT
jgi:hypothetical protein